MPPKPRPIEERFWEKVDKSGDCWVWKGTIRSRRRGRSHGYGVFKVPSGHTGSISVVAHRLAWELTTGPIPEGAFLCHRCDNPPCVNPSHLFVGTARENTQDMYAKGRARPPWRGRMHCSRGHDYTPGSFYAAPDGGRQCLICQRVRRVERIEKRANESARLPKTVRSHCGKGHALTHENAHLKPDGYVDCRACRAENQRRYVQRKRSRESSTP